jgi:hypothetical protein
MTPQNAMSTFQNAPEPDKKLTSDRFDDFREALEVLYVIANLSGRLQFVKRWPEAGPYILGEQLMEFDREGAKDRDLRAQLETEAEERRLALLEILDSLEENSAQKGSLQIEYVETLVKSLGRPLALCIYADRIVDRFIAPPPPPPEEIKEEAEAIVEVPVQQEYVPPVISMPQVSVAPVDEEEFFSHIEEDPLSIVQPISLNAPLMAPPAPLLDVPAEVKKEEPVAAPLEEPKPAVTQSVSMTFISSKKKPESDTKH